jgi:hypothetical protein
MNSTIVFINSVNDSGICKQLYNSPMIARLSIVGSRRNQVIPPNLKLWVDAGVDGLHSDSFQADYRDYLKQYKYFDLMADKAFQSKPDKIKVKSFVHSVLDRCQEFEPFWVSIPFLPMVSDNSRNKINRYIAEFAMEWKIKERQSPRFVIPCILTNSKQYMLKQYRSNIIRMIVDCVNLCEAHGLWIVDSTLNDSSGSDTLGHKKLPKLVELHEDFSSEFENNIKIIAGPYWGMNLVLWARGLSTYIASGLGRGYQYYIPGGIQMRSKTRIAITPLRRMAVVNQEFGKWLKQAIKDVSRNPKTQNQLDNIYKRLPVFQTDIDSARRQIAEFYKDWIDGIENISAPGRALALYQDLSEAFVIGKTITSSLPRDERPGVGPEKVAEQLMLNCL